MDALVAEKVWGLEGDYLLTFEESWEEDGICHYSTDIAAAWEVVDCMATQNWNWMLQPGYATFAKADDPGGSAFGCSVQHAICLAALKAKGVDV